MSQNQQKPNIPWWQSPLQLFLKMSSWIGGPIIVAVFIGKYLDKKYHSEPWLFLLSVGIAFIISTVMIVIVGLREMKKIEKQAKENKEIGKDKK